MLAGFVLDAFASSAGPDRPALDPELDQLTPRELDAGERRIVGFNAYVDEAEETPIPVLTVPPGSLEAQLARLGRTRRERDASAVQSALAGLRDAATRPGSSETNLMPHFLRCAAAYATLGEQFGVLREVFGEYREPVLV